MRIHFTGIAGAGMAAAALMMREAGHAISGSDQDVFPPMSTYVAGLGFPVFMRFDAANLPADLDLLVLGASAKLGGEGNPEVRAARARGVRITTFPELVGEATRARRNTVIAGSFGKSTLTAMIAHFLRAAGHDPGYFIGAIPLDLPTTGHWGADREMILEGDEYVITMQDRRSKFVLYHPKHTMISSLVHDHLNVFPTPESYEAPFADLVKLTPHDGLLVCAHAHKALHRITEGRRVAWYGLEPDAAYHVRDIVIGEITSFTLVTPRGERIALETELLGLHNIENIVGASALLLELGLVDAASLQKGARSFRGVARRLDKKTTTSRLPAYEGFGSSYEKARSAIEAIQLHFPSRPLVVVFEPHTFSWRNEEAKAWYDSVFAGVAKVLLLPPPEHGAGSHAQMSQADILARVRAAGVAAEPVANGAATLAALDASLSGGEVLLLLSSGPLDGLAATAPRLLDQRFGGKTT